MYKICHTEESSRRQRELEQGLLDLMASQAYAKITLTELCHSETFVQFLVQGMSGAELAPHRICQGSPHLPIPEHF